ncbi:MULTISPECIES: heavy-metal-associated domain-containing protein [unclassified Streptomyces]|uniref:heavy-metal-associated domain-containing protein n=1 Tax=unclassified Streptomyces TaxID=2593676 RepID=UPI00343D9793
MKLFGRKKNTDTDDAGTRVVLLVEGMHCSGCGLLIDDELEDIPGVHSSRTEMKTGRTTLHLEEGAIVDVAVLVAVVEQAGDYTARPAD